jgi:MFS family permease
MTDVVSGQDPAVHSLRFEAPRRRLARQSGSPLRPGVLLAIVLTGQFMAVLDASVVNVAAPSIHAQLHASGAALQLVIAGYTIAYAVLLVTGARLGDLLGHRRMFLAGLALFTLASLGCGLAASPGMLVALRFIQGVGAATMIPQVLSLIQRTFTGASRARAMSAYAAVLAGGVVVGQIAGGLLISANLLGSGWRPVFLVNVPIGAALLVAGRCLPRGGDPPRPPRVAPPTSPSLSTASLRPAVAAAPAVAPHGAGACDLATPPESPEGREGAGRGLDVPGLLTLSPAVLALVVPLVVGQSQHWPAWGWACLGGSAVLFASFAVAERWIAANGGSPLVPGRVLRQPGVALGIAGLFAVMTTFGGLFFALALHLQGGLGDSPLRAGLTFGPSAATFALVSLNWQRLPGRVQPRLAFWGFAGTTAALLALAAILRGGGSGGVALYLVLAVLGAAMASAFSPLMTAVLMRIPVADAADATGVIVTVNQLGLVIGVATFGTLYLNLAGSLPARSALHGAEAFRLLSAHAVSVTCVALAGVAVAGGVLAQLRARAMHRGAQPAAHASRLTG